MSGSRFVMPNQFTVTTSGAPGVGYELFFFETGTDQPQDTFSDSAFTVPNPNPITADANGNFGSIFLVGSPNYRVTLQDPTGTQVWTFDPVGPNAGGGSGSDVPLGAQLPFAGSSAPTGFQFCFGQALSRTVFSGLFAIIGTAYGSGDGSTTFNLPDKRGRVSIGKDDMGGSAANRVTSGGSGIAGTTLGAAGGSQFTQAHTHSLTDPGHSHTLTDPGHVHGEQFPNGLAAGDAQTLQNFDGLHGPTPWGTMTTLTAETGITIASAVTGISIASYGSGSSQNMPPGQVDNWIIRVT